MNSVLPVTFLLSALAVTGSVLNTATIVVLLRLKSTDRLLDIATRRLLLNISACHIVFAVVALPLRIWNYSVGAEWPFSYSAACSVLLIIHEVQSVTTLLDVSIAITRLVAVVWPEHYTRFMQSKVLQLALNLVPWLISIVRNSYAAASDAYVALADPQVDGQCISNVYSSVVGAKNGTAAATLSVKWIYFDFITTFVLPLGVGCTMYAVVFSLLYRQQQTKKMNRILPIAAQRKNPGELYCATTTTMAQRLLVNQKKLDLHRRRIRNCIVFACACALSIACLSTRVVFVGMFGFKRTPLSLALVVAVQSLVILVHPILYMALLPDMREVYRKLPVVNACSERCCCCAVKRATVVPTSTSSSSTRRQTTTRSSCNTEIIN